MKCIPRTLFAAAFAITSPGLPDAAEMKAEVLHWC